MNDGSLPKNWSLVNLSDVGTFESGGTPSKKTAIFWDGDIPFVTGADVTEFYVGAKNARAFLTRKGLDSGKTAICNPGTVLFVTRTRVGRVGIATETMGASQDLSPYICGPKVLPEYVCRYLLTMADYLISRCRGSTILGLTRDVVQNLQIPLPPIAEQRRIAAILDKADAIRRKRKQAIQYTEELLRATFLDMFGDPVTNPKGWEILPIESLAATQKNSLAIGPFGSALKVDDYREEGHPVVFVRDVRENQFNWTSEVFVDDRKFEELRSHRVYPGDVVATKMGTPPCIAAVYPDNMAVGVVTADIIKVTPNPEKATPLYISSAINSDFCKSQVTRFTEGITRPKVTLRDFKNLQVPCPPLASQHQWDLFFGKQKLMLKEQLDGFAGLDTLFNSLLQRAFRGEL